MTRSTTLTATRSMTLDPQLAMLSTEPETPATGASTPVSTDDDSSKQKKRGRRSRPKVKTGCSNCKQRRIKCDEKRPACSQCMRSQRDCTGYPPPSRHAVPYTELRIAPKPLDITAAPNAPLAGTPGPISRETILPPRRANHRQQYQQQLRPGSWGARDISPASMTPSSVTSSPTLYQPSNNIPLQGIEVPYFELFRSHTASELSGYFDSVFWTQRVLQECHTDPSIRHAAVALGALYKTLEQSSKTPSPEASPVPGSARGSPSRAEAVMSHWQVAVRQYSDACNSMMLLDGQTQHSHRTRLMVSVLLASFDAFIGDHKQAIIQIQNGFGLLERLQAEQARTGSREPVEEDLITIFARLAIQAKSYDLAFHFPEPYVVRLEPQEWPSTQSQSATESIPYPDRASSFTSAPSLDRPFTTLREARLAYDALGERGLRFIENLHVVNRKQAYPLFPASWRQYSLGFHEALDNWERAFQPLFDSRLYASSNLTNRERSGIATLKMSQVNSTILFRCMFNSTESHFDVFGPQFRMIVDLAHEIIAEDERRCAAERCPQPELCLHRQWDDPQDIANGGTVTYHIKPSFSADLGIVPPLFVVATKCRDPQLRRRAIQLLKSSARREGMWDSELVARIGQWVMEVEETGGTLQHPPSDDHSQNVSPADAPYGSNSGLLVDPAMQLGNMSLRPIPEDQRVMIHSVDFDLRAHFAELHVGTRGCTVQSVDDNRKRGTYISW